MARSAQPGPRSPAALLIVVLSAFLLAVPLSAVYASPSHPGAAAPPAEAEYTVASADSRATAQDNDTATRSSPLPETLTLVLVGTMLLGLAAAVRKTT